MVAERFISRKLKFQGNVAAIAIAVSFFVIIVAVAVSSGFRNEIREGVAAMTGDVSISPFPSGADEPESLPVHLEEESAVLSLPGVKDITPVVVRAGIVKNGDTVHGVMVKGVPSTGRESLEVSIPQRLSEILGLQEGDDLTTYFVGEKLRVRKFHIAEVHRDLVELDDNLLVYANLEDMQRLCGWDEDKAGVLEVRLSDRYSSARMSRLKADELYLTALTAHREEEEILRAATARQRYPQLFDWLDLIDFNVLAIILLMTVVAGFNMISGLLILLFRHISTIGTLKALGMANKQIAGVFLRVAARIVLAGMVIGNGAALLFCLLQDSTHLIRLNPENYFVSFVPVHIDPALVALVDVLAFAVIMLLLLIPTLFISKVDPAKTVRVR